MLGNRKPGGTVGRQGSDARRTGSSFIRLGVTLAGILALVVAFAAWRPATSRHAAGSSIAKGFSRKECAADRKAGTITYISPYAYVASAGIIEVLMAQHLNYFKDLCLNVTFNGSANGADALVNAGTGQASGASDASTVMDYVGEGQKNLEAVETVGEVNPETIVMNPADTSLKDLEGKTYGYTSIVSPVSLAMFHAAGVPLSTVHFVKLTDRNPEVIDSEVAAIGADKGSQDLTLKAEHVAYTEISATSLGVRGTTFVMYMNKQFVQKHPVAVENFIRADVKALSYCLVHQRACVANLAQVATAAGEGAVYGVPESTPVWAYYTKLIKYHETKPLGTFTTQLFAPEYKLTKEYATESVRISGVNETVTLPPLKTMIDTKLVADVYSGAGKLIWP